MNVFKLLDSQFGIIFQRDNEMASMNLWIYDMLNGREGEDFIFVPNWIKFWLENYAISWINQVVETKLEILKKKNRLMNHSVKTPFMEHAAWNISSFFFSFSQTQIHAMKLNQSETTGHVHVSFQAFFFLPWMRENGFLFNKLSCWASLTFTCFRVSFNLTLISWKLVLWTE